MWRVIWSHAFLNLVGVSHRLAYVSNSVGLLPDEAYLRSTGPLACGILLVVDF